MTLSLRHEFFVRAYLQNGSPTGAYRQTVKRYPGHREIKNPNTYKVVPFVILKRPEVKRRIEQLRAQMAKRSDITLDKILGDYEYALQLAKENGKPDSIVNAATAQAKLVGLLRERQEIGRPGDFEAMENVSEVLEAVSKEAGPAAALALAQAMGISVTAIVPEGEPEVVDLSAIEPPTGSVN